MGQGANSNGYLIVQTIGDKLKPVIDSHPDQHWMKINARPFMRVKLRSVYPSKADQTFGRVPDIAPLKDIQVRDLY